MLIPLLSRNVIRSRCAARFHTDGIESSRWPNIPAPGQKRTYCCKYGPADQPERYCRQFRATSVQASLFCVLFARLSGLWQRYGWPALAWGLRLLTVEFSLRGVRQTRWELRENWNCGEVGKYPGNFSACGL